LYLDIEPAVGLARAKGRGELDRIEQEALDFFVRTRQKYLELVDNSAYGVKIDAGQSIHCVHQSLNTALDQFLGTVC
jgi:dTMP kinase